MPHLLKDIDPDEVLLRNTKIFLPEIKNVAVGFDIEELYSTILKVYRENGNSAGCLKAYQKAISQNPKILKIVRIK